MEIISIASQVYIYLFKRYLKESYSTPSIFLTLNKLIKESKKNKASIAQSTQSQIKLWSIKKAT
jgi:hypothetical protein